jgi:tRNA A37 N6-isopentenylltransferase MiaA
MDIGSGKDLQELAVALIKFPYHLIDVVSPEEDFNVAKYQKIS